MRKRVSGVVPHSPMRRANRDGRARCGVDPSMKDTAAREDKRVRSTAIEDPELEIVIKWRCRYWLPVHLERMGRLVAASLDFGQIVHGTNAPSHRRCSLSSFDIAESGRRINSGIMRKDFHGCLEQPLSRCTETS
jgi:hypothetical protein